MALLAPAIADRLTETEAYLTTEKEAQEIEDALREVRTGADLGRAREVLPAIDERLARLTVPHEEWEVLYRQRLQVERDLLRGEGRAAEQAAAEAEKPGVVERVAQAVGNALR